MSKSAGINFGMPDTEYRLRVDDTGAATSCYNQDTGTEYIGGGDGGLEVEEGEWTPSEDTVNGEIDLNDNHDRAPDIYLIFKDDDEYNAENYLTHFFVFVNFYSLFNKTVKPSESTTLYSFILPRYRTSATLLSGNPSYQTALTGEYSTASYATNEQLKPFSGGNTDYFKAGVKYKWKAFWLKSAV